MLAELGDYLRKPADDALEALIGRAYLENRWFTPDNIRTALRAIAHNLLDARTLKPWAEQGVVSNANHPEKTIGLVMAGNIPLVGFHDWLCVFVSGQRACIKLSEKDRLLLPFLVKKLGDWAFESWEYTEFVSDTDRLGGFDAVIATGSNNTARYFEQYFAAYPHLIRRNRNSVAVLDGYESLEDLQALGKDIFTYFGLGCRNVSKLYLPKAYDFEPLLEALHEYRDIVLHDKYKNNFDYNFTLYIMNSIPFRNNGCLLLREEPSLHSRIASVHYELYDNLSGLEAELQRRQAEIQCIVGNPALQTVPVIPFGKSQEPGLDDYADGVDVMAFLRALTE